MSTADLEKELARRRDPDNAAPPSEAVPLSIEAALAYRDGTVTISVRDHGIGFLPRTDSPGLGLGLPLMASTADVMDITAPADGGVEVRLAFALRADAAVAAAA
jgi:serine/threonine-protein kinase RsbW/stage II sporulation protein AB (anti-sigma F factor)